MDLDGGGAARRVDFGLAAAGASLLLSAWAFLFPQPLNDDAFAYARTAQIFLDEGLAAAFAHQPWAGFGVLAGLAGLTGVPPIQAALAVNALFFALLAYAFVGVARQLDPAPGAAALAALTVLVYPELNEFRHMVIRDTGFWALSLLGLWQFMLFRRSRSAGRALAFCACLGLAALFRPEALLYLAAVPPALLFDRGRPAADNRRAMLRLYGLMGGSGLAVLLALRLAGADPFAPAAEFLAVYRPFLADLLVPDEAAAAAAADAIFGSDHASDVSRPYVTAAVLTGLLAVLFVTVFHAVGGPYFWLLLYGARRGFVRLPPAAAPLAACALANLLLLVAFLYLTRFLSSRYAIMLGLMLALQVPFVARGILDAVRGSPLRDFAVRMLVLFFFYCALDAHVTFGPRNAWLAEAAAFAAADPAPGLVTNSRFIAYHSGKVEEYDRVPRRLSEADILAARPGDLVAVELFHETEVALAAASVRAGLALEAVFHDRDGPRVAVYRRAGPPP